MTTQRQRNVQIAAVAVAVVLLLHHKLLLRLGSVLPGEAGSDVFRAHWSLWLVAEELPGWPFGTALVGFPNGVDLVPFPAVSLLAWAPLTALLGPDIAHALLVMAYTALAVVGGVVLVRVLGGSLMGGFLAGTLLATQPILGGALRDGTLEVLAVGWLPLQIAAWVLALRGSWRWGLVTAGLFLVICLESVYLGSFAALASLVALTLVRDRKGLVAVATTGLAVLLGAGVLAWVFQDVGASAFASVANLDEDFETVKANNAVDLDLLIQLALGPGERGWRVADLWSPPLAHWVVFGVGLLFALRRHAWLSVLSVLTLLMAMDHAGVGIWTDSSIGEVVRFPRRYLAAMAVFASTAAGLSLSMLGRWPRAEVLVGAGLSGYLALWGAHAGGYVRAYPLVEIPSVAFGEALAEDSEDCAVLFAPLEIPGSGEEQRQSTPVFASMTSDLASADLLFFQTRMNKASFMAPDLLTLSQRRGPTSQYAKAAIDLAFASTGQMVPGSAKRSPVAYEQELAWLMGEGLKYLVIDEARYPDEELALLLSAVEAFAVASEHYDDGSGVRVVQLYEERPPAAEVPVGTLQAVPDAGRKASGFQGKVTNATELHKGPMVVAIDVGGAQLTCLVKPEDGSFNCPEEVDGFRGVLVRVGETSYTTEIMFEDGEYRIRILEEQP